MKQFCYALAIICVAIGVQYVFAAELQLMMYVNYRANPPFVDCNALIKNTEEPELTQLAALEYIQVSDYKHLDGLNF